MTIRYKKIVLFGAAALMLAGCNAADQAMNTKAYRPIPGPTLTLMKEKGMTRRDPILVRIYKEESELEIWKKNSTGRYAHLKTYEICRWSGTLGPKKVEGDGQAPEGFYSVGSGQMKPNSQYFLAFNLGYPNAFDKSLGRSGAHLMVHGDCLSKGCYAMTDEGIAEVYAIAREALINGQPSFQVQALPFRMTAENMARRRDDKNFAFWQNLKEGSDHFELTKLEPKVDVCGRKYVFDATATGGGFNPNAACPSYEVNPAIAMAMQSKQRDDDKEFKTLIDGGLQTAEAYVPQNGRMRRSLNDPVKDPPPAPVMTAKKEPETTGSVALAMADTGNKVPMPVPSPYNNSASAQSKPKSEGGMFSWLRSEDKPKPAATPDAEKPAVTVAKVEQKTPAATPPVAASFAAAPKEEKTPFYKRWFGKKEEETAPAAPAAAAPPPSPAPKAASVAPTPAPKPAAPAPQPQAAVQPKPEPAPQPAPQAASAEPEKPLLPPVTSDGFGVIMPSGSFQ